MTTRHAGTAGTSRMVGKCAWCGRFRAHTGEWSPEVGADRRALVEVSHTICPECLAEVLAETPR